MSTSKKRKTKHHSSKPVGGLSQAEIWDDSALIRSWNDAVAEYQYYHSIHVRGEDVDEILRQAEMNEADTEAGSARRADSDVNREWRDVDDQSRRQDQAMSPAANGKDQGSEPGPEDPEDGEISDCANSNPGPKPNVMDGDMTEEENRKLDEVRHRVRRQFNRIIADPTVRPLRERDDNPRIDDFESPPDNGVAPPPVGLEPEQKREREAVPATIPATTAESGLQPTTTSIEAEQQTLENIKMAYYWAGYYSGLYDGQRQGQIPDHNQDRN